MQVLDCKGAARALVNYASHARAQGTKARGQAETHIFPLA